MGHINYKSGQRAEATKPEWLALGAQIGRLTNEWSQRGDIVAYVGPGAGGPAPACFTPSTAEVEVNILEAFGPGATPTMIGDLTDRTIQFEWPKATGAVYHEAMHARHSTWSLDDAAKSLTHAEMQALIYLEEGRIESLGVNHNPSMKHFLRACALELVLADIKEDKLVGTSTTIAANMAALTYARVDAGVLDLDDLTRVSDIVEKVLGLKLFNDLRVLWIQAQQTSESDIETLKSIARRWVELCKEASIEKGETPDGESGEGEGGESGEGEGGESGTGSASGASKKLMEELMEALEQDAIDTAFNAHGDLADQEQNEDWAKEVKSRGAAASQERDHREASAEIFGVGTGPMVSQTTRSTLLETRMPTGEERAAAVKVANQLDKARYRDRDATEIRSIVPPGRLRTRALVQGAAFKAKGSLVQVEPWRRTVRKHTDDPTLNIGMMVDISGSMGEAMQPMAVSAWVMSEAARRVQARAAMVYYGEGVFPTLKPGQHLDKVAVYTANDGTERFDKAFKALDGALNLLHGSGARMLVIASDANYTHNETRCCKQWLQQCDRQGVAILWLKFESDEHAIKDVIAGTKAQIVFAGTNVAAASEAIGAAAAKALTSAGLK